jgi:DNA-binding IclR family transcriptional regulator
MISAVSRTMAILECLSEAPKGATISELVTRLDVEKSIVSRIVATLEGDGYVVRTGQGDSFSIALRFAAITLRHIDQLGISEFCLPLLRELVDKTGELIQLAITENGRMVYVAQAEGKQRIRLLSLIGRSVVLHASTAGKVWLASLPEDAALATVLKQGFKPQTAKTIRTLDQLRAELTRVRKHGYATVSEELIEGAAAVGVPVWNTRGDRVLGAIVLSSPVYRLSKKRTIELVPMLKEAAAKLTQLGNIDTYFGSMITDEPRLLPEVKRKLA